MGEKIYFKNVEGKFAMPRLLPSIAALKDGVRRPGHIFLHSATMRVHMCYSLQLDLFGAVYVSYFGGIEADFLASAGAHCQQFCLAWKCWGCSAASQPCPTHAVNAHLKGF